MVIYWASRLSGSLPCTALIENSSALNSIVKRIAELLVDPSFGSLSHHRGRFCGIIQMTFVIEIFLETLRILLPPLKTHIIFWSLKHIREAFFVKRIRFAGRLAMETGQGCPEKISSFPWPRSRLWFSTMSQQNSMIDTSSWRGNCNQSCCVQCYQVPVKYLHFVDSAVSWYTLFKGFSNSFIFFIYCTSCALCNNDF